MRGNDELWAQYFSGNCSPEEIEAIQTWIEASYSNKEYASDMRALWESLELSNKASEPNIDQAWDKVHRRISVNPGNYAHSRPPVARSRSLRHNQLIRFAALVVVLMLPLGIAIWGDNLATEPEAPSPITTYASGKGERLQIQLNDGSMVYLSVDSKIEVPEKFSNTERTVKLSGEAFFEVAKDKSRPFRVSAGSGLVQVLGTAFNLRAYDNDSQVGLVVTEGRVSFGGQEASGDLQKIVVAGQKGVLDEKREVGVSPYENESRLLGWREGKLVFDNAPLAELTTELSRWYDITFSFQERNLEQILVTASFDVKQNEPLANILDIISTTTKLDYVHEDTQVRFRAK